MPFRTNMFHERIAQPETTFDEIEQMMIDVSGADEVTLQNADLYLEGDDDFKFGGILFVTIAQYVEETDPENDETREVNFDGFETKEAALEWLTGLGIKPRDINEV